MPPENYLPGSPADWLRHAYSDLEIARLPKSPNILLESLCFHAQQAAEKAIKAVLIANEIPIKKTHNIGILLNLLPNKIALSKKIQDAAILTDYAVLSRYPGDMEAISEKEYKEAVCLAITVVEWAEKLI